MRERFYRFMQGRHGQDEFTRFLLGAAVVGALLNMLVHSRVLYVLVWALLLYSYFRVLSRNHAARYRENRQYLDVTERFCTWFSLQKRLTDERKYHHIYTCPKCRQKIRIPKGKGKIMVRCPKCFHEFQKRS